MCCRAGLPSAPGEAQDKAGALCRGWLQAVNVGVQAAVPSAVLASRVPAAQGLCAGAGTLPPARLSTQPARELPTLLGEKLWGKEQALAGKEKCSCALERVLCGSGLLRAPHLSEHVCRGSF